MQNRDNAFTERGGDTVVMEKLVSGLATRGISVTVDLLGQENPGDYEIVHLLNFALPDMLDKFGRSAQIARTPFVVTALCEDVPSFHVQSHAIANKLIDYVSCGQPRNWWRENRPKIAELAPCPPFANSFAANNAAALFSNGPSESAVLKRDYPGINNVIEITLGHEFGTKSEAKLFTDHFKINDFVLCVGRLESRKNQLMLLKALEESDLPLVFVAGSFTYQPQYAEAALKFKRKGRTEFLTRLDDQMLASAYSAAKVHALPSWYELPGLVSLEAASNHCNIVASARGTAKDYLGENAFWCDTDDEDSILNAVTAAYYSPIRENLATKVASYTWDQTIEMTEQAYRQVLL